MCFANDTTTDQEHTCDYSRSVTTSTTWSNTTKIESTVSMSVEAGVPVLATASAGFSLTLGAQQSSSMTNTETITESDAVKVTVPAGKKVRVEVSVGRAEHRPRLLGHCENHMQEWQQAGLPVHRTIQWCGLHYSGCKNH